jgi:phosphoribosylaminoimidazolecarboxamide formyltransferase/IMP cyclohydrolase
VSTRRALISVHDKEGVAALGQALSAAGYELIASGGSAAALRQAGLAVRDVAEVTGAPEILGGRVKTLHPAIHGPILATADAVHAATLAEAGWPRIEVVVVNLYPFEQVAARRGATWPELIEEIDIGGVALIRAAAKNHAHCAVLVDPADYPAFATSLPGGGPDSEQRRRLAVKAFARTAAYDAAITARLWAGEASDAPSEPPPSLSLNLELVQRLRYGENPQQRGWLYRLAGAVSPVAGLVQLQGKELSYNNLADLAFAWRLSREFSEPACVAVKHANPCGVGLAADLTTAYQKAHDADPVSIFGGVVAFNRRLDAAIAAALAPVFLEVVVAPGFEDAAREVLAKKKNLRLVTPGPEAGPGLVYRIEAGYALIQEEDPPGGLPPETRAVTSGDPAGSLRADLEFAWRVCRHVRSNAIVLAADGATTGLGIGQTARIRAAEQAIAQAGARARGSVLASDAFFPFPDVVEAAAAAGIAAMVQPGGSVKDDEVIAAAERLEIPMLFTGRRHFRH